MRYPILPKVTRAGSRRARQEIMEIRHSSLYCPRDFDISPYFNVVKPTIAQGFDYKTLRWVDLPMVPESVVPLAGIGTPEPLGGAVVAASPTACPRRGRR